MKILFDISNVHLYPITSLSEKGVPTYETTGISCPGSVSLSLDQSGESTPIYADGTTYVVLAGVTSYEGTMENVLFSEEVLQGIYGYVKSSAGELLEIDSTPKEFGMKFDCKDENGDNVHFCLSRVSSTKPGMNVETKTESVSVNNQSVNLTVSSIPLEGGKNLIKSYATKTATNYENYFNSIEIPTIGTGGTGE